MKDILKALQKANTWIQMHGTSKAAILMYHCIAEPDLDPWGLSVTPEHFADHLDIMRRLAHPMSLQQLASAQQAGKIPDRAVAITFDDGYANNLYNAKPLLEQYDIPATVFITTGQVGAKREFWWDELERVLLKPGILPETLSLTIEGKLKQWQLGIATHYSQDEYFSDRYRKAWEGKPNSRLALYYSVWGTLKTLPDKKRQVLQDQILLWANMNSQARDNYRALTIKELLQLEQGGIFEIGAHTVTHPSLSAHSSEYQRNEIYNSKHWLEQLLSHSIKTFAYPFGNFNHKSILAVEKCGFEQACSTVQHSVWKGSDRFQLPRFAVSDCNQETFRTKLMRWVGI